jgi:AraC-like DNA-binding protein
MLEPNIPGGKLIREAGVAIVARVLRELCGPAWKPDLVTFPHRAHGPTEPYVRFFRAPVIFNSASAGLTFSKRVLRQPISVASQAVRDALKAQLDRLDADANDEFSDRVRRQIHIAMARGQFSESAVARSLDMDTSTLRRKLARESAKFRTVVQGVKFGIATQLIDNTDLTLADVAAAIGFYEKSVFSRAFRQWSGMAPSQWRERANGSSLR